jgi:hypothetical protein
MSTAGPTVAEETTRTAGDAKNSRGQGWQNRLKHQKQKVTEESTARAEATGTLRAAPSTGRLAIAEMLSAVWTPTAEILPPPTPPKKFYAEIFGFSSL